MPRQPIFGIFRGDPSSEFSWVASVPGIDDATIRIGEIAAGERGQYFIWDWARNEVVARIDTTRKKSASAGA